MRTAAVARLLESDGLVWVFQKVSGIFSGFYTEWCKKHEALSECQCSIQKGLVNESGPRRRIGHVQAAMGTQISSLYIRGEQKGMSECTAHQSSRQMCSTSAEGHFGFRSCQPRSGIWHYSGHRLNKTGRLTGKRPSDCLLIIECPVSIHLKGVASECDTTGGRYIRNKSPHLRIVLKELMLKMNQFLICLSPF